MTGQTKYKRYPSLRLYDRLGVPYVLHSNGWHGPLWTGHCMMLDMDDSYGDVGFFHELSHWVEASEKQRTCPDFALGQQINAAEGPFGSSSTPFIYDGERRSYPGRNNGWGERPVTISTASRQEAAACNVMFFYEALVGLSGWDDTIVPNGAALDFDGFSDPALSQPSKTIVQRSWKILSAMDPDLTHPVAQRFFERMADLALNS